MDEGLISLILFLLKKYSKSNKEKMKKHSVAGDGLGAVVGRHLVGLIPLGAGSGKGVSVGAEGLRQGRRQPTACRRGVWGPGMC